MYKSDKTGKVIDEAIDIALTVGKVDKLQTRDRTTVVNAINELNANTCKVQDAVLAAQNAEGSAHSAESYLEDVKEAIEDLPDGSAVSAQVALNVASITQLQQHNTLISFDTYKTSKKENRYYFVAKDASAVAKNNIWRIYWRTKPIMEFNDSGVISHVWPRVFPHMYG